ncbi:TPA: hypothetical protein N0F65_009222 [Lagenidium giganteum]|uniref:RING-type E3 ubiquitin transferase n=1 Tax=Lagenidium giganteum TaxID=4803 RepID=A0AAV2YVP5_9STRA|nr:TPA: hypothetical protein N0F65_009222 [Lagenidium giganteum]
MDTYRDCRRRRHCRPLSFSSRGKSAAPATPSPPGSPNEFIAKLSVAQRLVSQLLGVHTLSRAIEYFPEAPICVNGEEWWREIQQQTTCGFRCKRRRPGNDAANGGDADLSDGGFAALAAQLTKEETVELYSDALHRVVHCLDGVNRARSVMSESESSASEMATVVRDLGDYGVPVLDQLDKAVAHAGAQLIEAWFEADKQRYKAETMPPLTSACGHLINALLQYVDIGTNHAFHHHALHASIAYRVVNPRLAKDWECSVCRRKSPVGPTPVDEQIVVYHCPPCEFLMCHECFTRIPNENAEGTRRIRQTPKRCTIDRFFTLTLEVVGSSQHFGEIVAHLADVCGRRAWAIPFHWSLEKLPLIKMLHEIVKTRGFPEHMVHDPSWCSPHMTMQHWRKWSILGPLLANSSITSEANVIDTTSNGRYGPLTLTLRWKEGFVESQRLLLGIVQHLLSDEQPPDVVDAATLWLTCTYATSSNRRSGEREDDADGYLTNIATLLARIMIPILDQPQAVDPMYHQGHIPRRSYGLQPEQPLRSLGEDYDAWKKDIEERRIRAQEAPMLASRELRVRESQTRFVRKYDAHADTSCDYCGEFAMASSHVRYKCSHCENSDLCERCHDRYRLQQPGHDSIHPFGHVFLRTNHVIPFISVKYFFHLPPQRRRSLDHEPDTAPLDCAECGVSLENAERFYRCANCFDVRLVCVTCHREEEREGHHPSLMHIPGHLYFEISAEWCRWYSPTAPELHFRWLYFPAPMFPRERFEKETELFHTAIKVFHVGPLFTCSRFVELLKEMKELEVFCLAEEDKHERQSASSRSRTPPKKSPHYTASRARLVELGATKAMLEMHLLEPSSLADWFAFYGKACRWLLGLASTTQNAFEEVVTDFTATFSAFPEHFFTDVCNLACMLALPGLDTDRLLSELSDGHDVESVVEAVLVMLFQLMASVECTKNPHLRVEALKAMVAVVSVFARPRKSTSVPVVAAVFQKNELLAGHALSIMMQFHEDIESYHQRNNGMLLSGPVAGDSMLWGFVSVRATVAVVMRLLWQIPHQRKQINRLLRSQQIPASSPTSQFSMFICGLWNDASKLLDEGMGRMSTLRQLLAVQSSIREGNVVHLPFPPNMLEGYLALYSKQLRLTFRVLVELLESLSWMAGEESTRRGLLKPELVDLCTRTLGFMLSSLATAHEAHAWDFLPSALSNSNVVLANLVILAARCADLAQNCPSERVWHLGLGSGEAMTRLIGDFDVHDRWRLNIIAEQWEMKANILGSNFLAVDKAEADRAQHIGIDEEMDEHQALAMLEQQTREAADDGDGVEPQSRASSRQLTRRFISALANDGRFDAKRFQGICEMLHPACDYAWIGSEWMQAFSTLLRKCTEMVRVNASMDDILGDIPEAYLDPLLNTIMTDPVRLPSGHIVDRTVIERHLLSSQPVDPFSRAPLSASMLVPCDALRKEIRLFIRTKLAHVDAQEDILANWGLGWDTIFTSDDHQQS